MAAKSAVDTIAYLRQNNAIINQLGLSPTRRRLDDLFVSHEKTSALSELPCLADINIVMLSLQYCKYFMNALYHAYYTAASASHFTLFVLYAQQATHPTRRRTHMQHGMMLLAR